MFAVRWRCIVFVTGFYVPPAFPSNEEIDLGFSVSSGTYTIAVQLPCVGERMLTLDTGASYTVLDQDDVMKMKHVTILESRVRINLVYEGRTVPASVAIIPGMRVGNCVLHNREVVVTDLPDGRSGALGMNDLEALAPFTFVGNGALHFACPRN